MLEHDDERARQIKLAAQQQWSHDPAGGLASGEEELGTPESFARVERYRYQEQPWMHDTFQYRRFAGLRVLEIGVGLGTDHLQFARAGGHMAGIDLTPRCVELTQRRLEQEGLRSDLRTMDAEHLDFQDDAFDVVYSFGVLHHTASAERAFREVRRVLRPGGVFIGGLYNRHSIVTAAMRAQCIFIPRYRGMSFQERLSLVEYSTSEDRARPYVRLFSTRELRQRLRDAGFTETKLSRRHFGIKLRRRVPSWLEAALGRIAGWYVVHEAS